jgi:hypothetical protein
MRQTPRPAAAIIFLIGLLLLASPGRSAPDGDAPGTTAAPVADAALFARELQAAGALKFSETTEDLLRTGQFERALLRYAFLRGQIARQPGYRPLVHQIDQRLHFLRSQLRLPEGSVAPLKAPPMRRKPAEKKEATQAALPAPDGKKGDTTPASEAKSDPAGSPPRQDLAAAPQPPASQEKPEDLKAEAEKPPPPPSTRWQRIKKRLLFWRK